MNLIVAVDEKWGIGKKNGLLFNIPDDMKFFKEKTINKVVCMGYNTLLSFPCSKPLKNRINVVLAPKDVERDDCIVVHDLLSLKDELSKYNNDDIFVIGGGMFYKTMLPYCDKAFITEIYADGKAEIFFPNLSLLTNWEKENLSDVIKFEGVSYRFTLYKNKSTQIF